MSGEVFVTGASGFVGRAVIAELVRRGRAAAALLHRSSPGNWEGSVRCVRADLFDVRRLAEAMAPCAAVIHLVGIIQENHREEITFERIHVQGTGAAIEAARSAGVERFVHMSALGTRPDAPSRYHQTKYQAECCIRDSGLKWTIFRPSLIHGPEGQFMKLVAMWARKKAPAPLFFAPFMPYFGGRRPGRIQPVYVEDVARAFVDALENSHAIGQTYELAGPEAMTWPEFYHTCAQEIVHRARWVAGLPPRLGLLLAAAGLGRLLGFNRDQVLMSLEDNVCDLSGFVRDFGWEPRSLVQTLRLYAAEI